MQFTLNLIALSTCFMAAIADVRSGKISNWLTMPALGLAIGLQVVYGLNWELVEWQRLGLSALLLVLFLPVLLAPRGIGGGDLKLILVLVVTLGMPRTVFIIIFAALTAAIAMGLRGLYNPVDGRDRGIDENSVQELGGESSGPGMALAPFFAGYCMLVLLADYCVSLEDE